jgi:hypothetical protein
MMLTVAQNPALLPTFPESRNVPDSQYSHNVLLTIDPPRNEVLFLMQRKSQQHKADWSKNTKRVDNWRNINSIADNLFKHYHYNFAPALVAL